LDFRDIGLSTSLAYFVKVFVMLDWKRHDLWQKSGGDGQQAGKRHRQPEKLATNKEDEEFHGPDLSARVRSPCINQTGQMGIPKTPRYLNYFIKKLAL
jgi:hypothetical protein